MPQVPSKVEGKSLHRDEPVVRKTLAPNRK